MSRITSPDANAEFWRDPALPFIEARAVRDGRLLCYARHAHETFSIGAITAGRSTYINRDSQQQVSAGTLVLMNPGDVHACNPLDGQPWSYLMLYVDAHWLGALQQRLGLSQQADFEPLSSILSQKPALFHGLLALHQCLIDKRIANTQKAQCAVDYFSLVLTHLRPAAAQADKPARVEQIARYIEQHCTQPLSLDALCAAAELSPSYLIRAFKRHYGLTPHAFLLNRRIQYARQQLRHGRPLADVAQDAGFADQAHFQRTFKHLLATTPGQYQR